MMETGEMILTSRRKSFGLTTFVQGSGLPQRTTKAGSETHFLEKQGSKVKQTLPLADV